MNSSRRSNRFQDVGRWLATSLAVCLLAVPALGGRQAAPEQQMYASPEEALEALKQAAAAADRSALPRLFGPAGEEMYSNDPIADKAAIERFAKRLKTRTHLVKRDEAKYALFLGAENWQFPFPIIKKGERWMFDGEAGLEEIITRRIGANELTTIKVCREFARAQSEYADEDRDGDEVLEYAQKFASTANKRDGLYWQTAEDEPESPLGPIVAYATAEGRTISTEQQNAFHGYYFRILTRQGASAPGGAYSYVINGNMIGGFAIVAYPAEWGDSGLMTFVVSHHGKVYQKDLGPQSIAAAKAMRAFNPDSTWQLVERE